MDSYNFSMNVLQNQVQNMLSGLFFLIFFSLKWYFSPHPARPSQLCIVYLSKVYQNYNSVLQTVNEMDNTQYKKY